MKTYLKMEISETWTRKTEALKCDAQFQRITVEIKERIEHRIRQSNLPTKPTTDRHSTNFTNEHKSLKVSNLWSYWCQVSFFKFVWKKSAAIYDENSKKF